MASSVFIGYFGGAKISYDGTSITFPGPILLPDGSASAPSMSFASDTDTGIFWAGSGAMDFTANSAAVARVSSAGAFVLGSSRTLEWGSSAFSSPDVSLSRGAAGQLNSNSSIARTGSNGQLFHDLQSLTELTTIAAAATTDTTIQMPANSVVLAVSVRTTVVIPDATSYSVGDSGSATRFSTANVGVAANSTDPGTKAGAYYNASALSVRLTMNGGTPAAATGRVRVTIYYYSVTPPTS